MATAPGTLADVDPLAIVRAHLITHPKVLAEFAKHTSPGDDGLGEAGQRILTSVRAPYPMLQLNLVGGDPVDLVWRSVADVQLTAWGDTDGTISGDQLRRLLLVAMAACKELETKTYGPADAVVTHVTGGTPGLPFTDPETRQPYHVGTVALTMHPPIAVPISS